MTEAPADGSDNADVQAPKSDRIGNDYQEGPNPQPGGDVDLSGSTIPPYDDRSTGDEEVAAGVPAGHGQRGTPRGAQPAR